MTKSSPSVVFPSAGTWRYEVNDGFLSGVVHTFPPVEVGRDLAPAPAASQTTTTTSTATDDGSALRWLVIPGIALLFASIALLVWDRRRQRPRGGQHQPQAA